MSTKSRRVWESRYLSALKLAKMGDVDFDKALDIILRTISYALADAREWERDNNDEMYCNSAADAHKTDLLDKRRAKLEEEWNAYGLTMVNYGIYTTITDREGGSDVIHLAYFD